MAFDGVYGSTKDNSLGNVIATKAIGNENFEIIGMEAASAAFA